MNTLALDCSFAGLTLALGLGGKLYSRGVAEVRASDKLLPLLQELLAEAKATTADIERMLVTVGPGSFTGIRLGLAVAEGLKLVHSKLEVVGIGTLTALAAQVVKTHQPKTPFTLLLDAAGGQAYRQDFAPTGKALAEPVCEPLAGVTKLKKFIVAQAGLLPPFATHATLTGLEPEVLLALAVNPRVQVPAAPLYLKELAYRHAG